jgi:hypothetical protein
MRRLQRENLGRQLEQMAVKGLSGDVVIRHHERVVDRTG